MDVRAKFLTFQKDRFLIKKDGWFHLIISLGGILLFLNVSCSMENGSSYDTEIYQESFANNTNGWTTTSGGEQSATIADGFLTLTNSSTSVPCILRVVQNGSAFSLTGPYKLEVAFSFPSQPDSTYAKALIQFNYYTTNNGPVFDYVSVTSSGYYLVGHYPSEEGNYYYYTGGYVFSGAINQEGKNRLSITQYGGGFSLAINGSFIGFYTNTFYSGMPYQFWLGLEKGATNSALGSVSVQFDELTIYQ
jgi:hypothetical protein